jgi:hypothetical protein
MGIVCKLKNNFPTIRFLVSKGGKIDGDCLKDIIDVTKNKIITFAFNEVIANGVIKLETNNDQMNNTGGARKLIPFLSAFKCVLSYKVR